MKKLLLFGILLISLKSISQIGYQEIPKKIECSCEICGISIFYYEYEKDYYIVDDANISFNYYNDATVNYIDYRKIMVCDSCYTNYKDEFIRYVNSWIFNKKEENTKLRKKYDAERKEKEKLQREEKIKQLEQQLKELKSK